MLTTKVNKEKRRKKIAREKEEKIRRENNQKIEKERRKRIKKQRRQKINNFKKTIAGCSREGLEIILGEIKSNSVLLNEDKDYLKRRILNRPSLPGEKRDILPDNVIEEIKNEENLSQDMRWRLYEAERDNNRLKKEIGQANNKVKNEKVKPP